MATSVKLWVKLKDGRELSGTYHYLAALQRLKEIRDLHGDKVVDFSVEEP